MTTSSIIAVTETPTIVCPSWCRVTQEEHVAQLPDFEGRVIHWSSERTSRAEACIRIARTTYVDGTLDSEGTNLYIEDGFQDGVSLPDAAAFVALLSAALKEAQA